MVININVLFEVIVTKQMINQTNQDNDDSIQESETLGRLIQGPNIQQAARYFSGELTEEEKESAIKALGSNIVFEDCKGSNPGLGWTISLLEQESITDKERARLCNLYLFIFDAIENDITPDTRLELIEAINQVLIDMTAREPNRLDWQHNLSFSYERIGSTFENQGNMTGALEAYETSLEIVLRLHDLAPENVQLQSNMMHFHINIGDILKLTGDDTGALNAYQKSVAIAENLTNEDPDNIEWRRHLSISLLRVGLEVALLDKPSTAIENFLRSVAITNRLVVSNPEDSLLQNDLAMAYIHLVNLYKKTDNQAEGMKFLRLFLRVSRRMKRNGLKLDANLEEIFKLLEEPAK